MKDSDGEKTVGLHGQILSFAYGLRTRFMLMVSGLFIGLSVLMIAVVSYLDVHDERAKAVEQAVAVSATVSHLAVPHLVNHHYLILEQELESIATNGSVLIAQVRDPRRSITIDADPDTRYFDAVPLHPLMRRALEEERQQIKSGREMITVATPIRERETGAVLGASLVVIEVPDVGEAIGEIWKRNTLMVFLVLLVGMPVAFHYGKGFLDPIRSLTRTAHRVSAGDFDAPFPVERRDEIGVLARAYRDMVRQIRANIGTIQQLAFLDGVTGLCNREYFRRQLEAMTEAGRNDLAVLFIDLDRFKQVNDTFGHEHGDRLLAAVADRIREVVGGLGLDVSREPQMDDPAVGLPTLSQSRYVARLGGDEFAILLPGSESSAGAAALADRLLGAIGAPIVVGESSHVVGASIGIARYPQDGETFSSILKSADIAMYQAKNAGGGAYRFYSREAEREAAWRLKIEAELRLGLSRGEIEVFYQPQVDCRSRCLVGVEALARWRHPELGVLAPAAFIEIAEETGLIIELGRQVLAIACRQAKAWSDAGRPLPVSVNVSVLQLEAVDFSREVERVLEDTGLDPSLLELELTETLAMQNVDQVQRSAEPLRRLGVRFALDDFGTGYSSLAHLRRMPFDTFKIDRGFIAEATDDEGARLIVQAIVAMAESLQYETVAEGVETDREFALLGRLGCRKAQGYYFAAPMSQNAFETWRTDFERAGATSPDVAAPGRAAAMAG